MKTSNKLLLGLLIVIIVGITVNLFVFRDIIIKEINNNPEQNIEMIIENAFE